ncbi:MAG: glutamyl-Q tRNA(Asp) ligase [Acidimicrobiales bacterium]|nr:glutamyl-Q tRNA(Asp) ligase [Acidimicrobiales bacterium]
MEDLDRMTSSAEHERHQLEALAAIGLNWDGDVVRQSERFDRYDAAIAELTERGSTYECFCTRREIRDAIRAPHEGHLAYPGTCRELTAAQRAAMVGEGRRPAIRLRAGGVTVEVVDELVGPVGAVVDDVVLRRNDGVPAYNLAVVVDDAAQGVTEVVRGDDLLATTPRQVLLQRLLGLPTPRYVHVPLVVGADGARLAKRHGAVTLTDVAARGIDPTAVRRLLDATLGSQQTTAPQSAHFHAENGGFDVRMVPREPWVIPLDLQRSDP